MVDAHIPPHQRNAAPQQEVASLGDLRNTPAPLVSASEVLFSKIEPPLEQTFAERFARLSRYHDAVTTVQRTVTDPSRQGLANGSEVDLTALDPAVRVIIVGDIHGEVAQLKRILTADNNLEDISNGRAVLVLLGDLVHPVYGNPVDMESSIRTREIYENLKIAYPHNVFTLVGNHDPLYESCIKSFTSPDDSRTNYPQNELFLTDLEHSLYFDGGSMIEVNEFLDLYASSTRQAAYVLVANGAVATHAGPISQYSREEIRSCRPLDNPIEIARCHEGEYDNQQEKMRQDVHRDACWRRWKDPFNPYDASDVQHFLELYGQPTGHLIVGHSPPRDKSLWRQALLVRGVDGSSVDHTVMVASGQRTLGYAVLQYGEVVFKDLP